MYDHMGLTMLISAVWCLVGLAPAAFTLWVLLQAPLLGAFLVFSLTAVGLFGPITAATYAVADAVIQGEPVGFRDFFRFFREHYLRAAGLTAALIVILSVLVVDLIFFTTLPYGWAGYVVFLWIYFIVFFGFMAGYAYPLAVRKRARLFPTLKTAFLLAADNLVVSVIVAVTALALGAASLYLQAPFLLFVGGTLGFLHSVALDEVMKKYSALRQGDGDEEADEDQGAKEESPND